MKEGKVYTLDFNIEESESFRLPPPEPMSEIQLSISCEDGQPFKLAPDTISRFCVSYPVTKNVRKLTSKRANGTKPAKRKRRIVRKKRVEKFDGQITNFENGQVKVRIVK